MRNAPRGLSGLSPALGVAQVPLESGWMAAPTPRARPGSADEVWAARMILTYPKCPSIIIDGSSMTQGGSLRVGLLKQQKYEHTVAALLDKMAATWTGKALLRGLDHGGRHGRRVRIVPYTDADRKEKGGENAYAMSRSARDATPRGVVDFVGGTGDGRFRMVSYKGTGAGSDSEIHFTPQDPVPICGSGVVARACRLRGQADNNPDELLLHELVHSMREMLGQLHRYPTSVSGYDNEEEFFAILLANIYISEKGGKVLRSSHHGFYGALSADLAGSEKFLGKDDPVITVEKFENRRLVKKLAGQNYDVCSTIAAHVTADFNPIGEYMTHGELYPDDPARAYSVARH